MEKYFQWCVNFSVVWFLWALWGFLCTLARAVVWHVFLLTLSKEESHRGSEWDGDVAAVSRCPLVTHEMTTWVFSGKDLFLSHHLGDKGQTVSVCLGNESVKLVVLGGKKNKSLLEAPTTRQDFPKQWLCLVPQFSEQGKKQREAEEEQCSRWQPVIPC